MSTTKLILIEGLPSAGKSTTARIVDEVLKENNINHEVFYEGNLDHPADYDGVAFFKENDYKKLIEVYKSYKDEIYEISIKKALGYFIEYKKAMRAYENHFPKDLWRTLFENDVYELPLDLHMKILKEKWTEFATRAQKEDKIYIFDCPFIQNPLTVTMIRDNAEKTLIIKYIKELEKIIVDLNPILLYVDQKDIIASFNSAIEQRPKEWLDFFINYYTEQGYGQQHDYKGLDGVKQLLLKRQKLEYEVLQSLNIRMNMLDNSELHYERHKNKIEEMLKTLRD